MARFSPMPEPLRLAGRKQRWRGLAVLACAILLVACHSPPPAATPSARQVAALRRLGFKPGADGWEIDFAERILFEVDSDRPDAQATRVVGRIGRTLASVGIRRMRIEGHADSTGPAAYNRALSLRRARIVAGLLVASGFDAAAIEAIGLGSDAPVADNASPAGRAENRRVAIIVPVP